MTDPNDDRRKASLNRRAGIGMALAIALGAALGAALDQIALGIAIGIVVGGYSVSMARRRKGDNRRE